jgi:hypothetical protein
MALTANSSESLCSGEDFNRAANRVFMCFLRAQFAALVMHEQSTAFSNGFDHAGHRQLDADWTDDSARGTHLKRFA